MRKALPFAAILKGMERRCVSPFTAISSEPGFYCRRYVSPLDNDGDACASFRRHCKSSGDAATNMGTAGRSGDGTYRVLDEQRYLPGLGCGGGYESKLMR